MKAADYIIITPVRNEAALLSHTIGSVLAQSLKPAAWIVVNDGSTDGTQALMDQAAAKHDWIWLVHRPDRGFRKPGAGVMEAFCDGYDRIGATPWEFLAKLDGDLSFAPDYFEKCVAHFTADPKLGIAGGTVCGMANGRLRVESSGDPPFHVRGATKIYRRKCWNDIGGLLKVTGWDTLDEVKANMLGWSTRSFPDLPIQHHRYAGDADGAWKNWVKNGRANYVTGYHPLFMFAKCLSRLAEKPRVLASVALGCGFISGYLRRAPRVQDADLIRYLRDQQIRRLTLRESLWTKRA